MKFFVSNRTSLENAALITESMYWGIELALDEEIAVYLHFRRDGAHATYLLACFGDAMDFLLGHLQDRSWIKRHCKSWPVTTELLSDVQKKRCRDCALVRLKDLDDGNTKWFLSARISTTDFHTTEELFCKQTIDAIGKLENAIMLLIEEVSNNRPVMFPKHAKTAFRGYISGLLTSFSGGE